MKNFRIVLSAIALSLVVSCDDAIDITQPSELLPEDTFETIADLQLGINGVYGAVPGEGAIYFTSTFTDEVAIGIANGGQGRDGELAFVLNNNNGSAAGIWVSNYLVINLANRLIAGAEFVEVEEGSAEAAQKASIIAEARALRAFAHFTLLSYFSPNLKDDSSLGVILLDFVPETTDELTRATTGEVFDFINEDLAFAEANLTDVSIAIRDRVGLNFIKALKARMFAYRGQYAEAKQLVDELDGFFGLSNQTNYSTIWTDADGITATPSPVVGPLAPPVAATEVIFRLQRANSGGNGNFYQFWSSVNSSVNGAAFFEVNRALFNLTIPEASPETDVRRTAIVDASAFSGGFVMGPEYATVPYDEYISGDILPVGKYPGSEDLVFLNDLKVFRFSEMVLIRAEYYASIGDNAGVAAEINAIRRARHGSATANPINLTGASSQAVWKAILDERRVELAFEGHRYLDLKRLATDAGTSVERDARDCAFNGFCTLPSSEFYKFTLPIPRAEQSANPGIQQNPGYGGN